MERRIKDHLCSMFGMAPGDVEELYAIGQMTLDDTLSRLQDAILGSRQEDIVDVAHMLKGTLYNMGISELGDLARQIELDAKAGIVDQAEGRLTTIRSLMADVLPQD